MQQLANDVRLACQLISRRVRFEGTHDIAPHQFSVLIRLRDGATTPSDLASIERVSAPSMTRTVNCLEEAGYVRRVQHPDDGRQVLVQLTDDGEAVLDRTIGNRDSWMMSRIAMLNDDERDQLREASAVLAKLASS